jgi:hypothetical protein
MRERWVGQLSEEKFKNMLILWRLWVIVSRLFCCRFESDDSAGS